MRVALIHALRHSPPPVEAAFRAEWPDATLMNLLDDSLSADLSRAGRLTPTMFERFRTLSRYAAGTGAQGILFTCSAFGPPIEAVVALGRRIGLLATFAGSLATMPAEFPAGVEVVPCLAEGALAALDAGDFAAHDRLAAEASRALVGRCDAILLSQFSLARAAPMVAAATGLPVVTTPGSAVRRLKSLLAG